MFFAQKWFAAFLTKYCSAIFMVEFNYAYNRRYSRRALPRTEGKSCTREAFCQRACSPRVEGELRRPARKKKRRLKLPLIRSKRPGSLEVDNDKIYDLISFPLISMSGWPSFTNPTFTIL